MNIRRTPVHRVLHRHNLLIGGERMLVIVISAMCAAIPLSVPNVFTVVLAILIWAICMTLLRMMAKADPQLSQVYLRSLQYKEYYPARSRLLLK